MKVDIRDNMKAICALTSRHHYSGALTAHELLSMYQHREEHLQWDELRSTARGLSRLYHAVPRPGVQSPHLEAGMSL